MDFLMLIKGLEGRGTPIDAGYYGFAQMGFFDAELR